MGKTMLSVALGRAAVDAGHRVYFTTAAELAAKCHKAALEGRWKTCMRFFAGLKLLITDELDYLPLSEDGASALFQVIDQRYLKSSTILTTNVGFADWAGVFGDATVAAAMLDRLLHRAAVAGIDGPSYRLRDHQNQADAMRKGVNARVSWPHSQRRPAHPRPINYPVRAGKFAPNPRQIYCSSLQERRPPMRSRRPGRPHTPGLRRHLHREPPTPPGLLLARMPSRVGKATQPNPPRGTGTTPRRTPPNLATQEAARPTITNRVTDITPLRRLQ
ncbi:ATP-binding protein [Streptomyces olivaceus]|uniref:ATP-binding protein n=1 Tax=Streptomyces olivaceus TaxID=47716 RepID=UPI0033253A10